jgi:hypothetical protein
MRILLLSILLTAHVTLGNTFTVFVATNPPAAGTITGAGTYPDGDIVDIQVRSNPGWYIRDITFEGPTYPETNGQQRLNPEQQFDQAILIQEITIPNFDRTTMTNFDTSAWNIGDSTTTAWFGLLSPAIDPQPISQVALTGTDITFASGAAGRNPITYRWQKDGLNLTNKTTPSLDITNVQLTNAGSYVLIASNAFGVTSSIPANLIVRHVVTFANGVPIVGSTFEADQQTTISCQSIHPHIFYTLDGSEPSFESTQYTGEFVVSTNSVFRAIAYKNDFSQSVVSDPITIVIHPLFSLQASSPVGSFVFDPPGGSYRSNTLVTIVSVPYDGWTFMEWSGDLSGNSPTNTILMNQNRTVSAMFGTGLTTGVAGSGSVTLHPQFPLHPFESIVRLSAIPNTGRYFNRWIWGDESDQANPLDFSVMSANQTVSALFSTLPAGKISLTVLSSGRGIVIVNTNVYQTGATSIIQAVPDPGHQFLRWSGDASGSVNPLFLVMNSNKVVTAEFTRSFLDIDTDTDGSVRLSIAAMPGVYRIDTSTNLPTWTPWVTVTNFFDVLDIVDSSAPSPMKVYRAVEP